MAEAQPTTKNRPAPIHAPRSFTRMESLPTTSPSSPRKRASTLQESGIPAIPAARKFESSPEVASGGKRHMTDVFENREDNDDDEEEDEPVRSGGTNTPAGPELQLPSTFDELPIEIRSLTERFLESLSAKVHPTPLSADQLSELFQDFYERAASHIATHIASLSSRIGREKSPAPSVGSSRSSQMKGRPRAGSGAKRADGSPSGGGGGSSGGEMLTASEVADRRKARRLLELKRVALEEAVERCVCEKVYDRIWKHRSTDDDARDGKLRSRTAALSLVGIGLKELHVDTPTNLEARQAAEDREDEIHRSLATAREALQRMDDECCPLAKLQHLTAAHKSVVETLSQLFPSSSSADEILPTLIYTLITSPPEGINVVSNLNFIQRFRASSKVDGEAAYCLVNLEAAISFLETVDLSSLRADELPEGPLKSNSRPSTPILEKETTAAFNQPPAAQTLKPTTSPITITASEKSTVPQSDTTPAIKALPITPTDNRPTMQQRRISALVQAPIDRIEAGRENFLNAADKIYDSVNGTLENSFQFVFGRFKEQQSAVGGESPLPKTLEEARKLVSSPAIGVDGGGGGEEDESGSGRSSPAGSAFASDPLTAGNVGTGNNQKMLELVGGRKQLRDRSADSTRSGGSGKRLLFAASGDSTATTATTKEQKSKDDIPTPASAGGAGNLFANINPLNRFGVNVPSFARFGRAGSLPSTPVPPQPSPGLEKVGKLDDIVESPVSTTKELPGAAAEMVGLEKQRSRDEDDDLNAREALAELRRLRPPKKRFLEVSGAAELRVGEVEELLGEYRRLAKAIGEAIAA